MRRRLPHSGSFVARRARVNPLCELTPTPGDKGPSTGKTIRSVIRQHATGEGREKVGVGCRRR